MKLQSKYLQNRVNDSTAVCKKVGGSQSGQLWKQTKQNQLVYHVSAMVQPSMTFQPTGRHLKTSKLLLCMPIKMISCQSWWVMQEFIIGWRFTRDIDRVLVFAVFFLYFVGGFMHLRLIYIETMSLWERHKGKEVKPYDRLYFVLFVFKVTITNLFANGHKPIPLLIVIGSSI